MHHKLDIEPIPEKVLYINEPWLFDESIVYTSQIHVEPDNEEDNVRVYLPLDLNRKAILRRLNAVIQKYGEANEKNEFSFEMEVNHIIFQVEIYDQVWFVRGVPVDKCHSTNAVELVKEIILRLKDIPDGCAETFPFELIERLENEYLNN